MSGSVLRFSREALHCRRCWRNGTAPAGDGSTGEEVRKGKAEQPLRSDEGAPELLADFRAVFWIGAVFRDHGVVVIEHDDATGVRVRGENQDAAERTIRPQHLPVIRGERHGMPV
jgi:hypothetical protein